MPHLCDPKLCVGCSACTNSCSHDCISMAADTEGFMYPVVDEHNCVACGLCEKNCPVLNTLSPHKGTTAFAAVNNDSETRCGSTSGGVFSLLAHYILKHHGVVFGAAYELDFSVSHQWIDDPDQLYKFRGAKYVQSCINDSYRQVKDFLNADRYVLFSGTPCQIAGLRSYLGKEYPKLICVDLICHGIPSEKVWKHYVDYRAQKDNNGILPVKINMRSKTTGWQKYSVEFTYTDKQYSVIFADDPYMQGYIRDLYTRPSCFDCKFKGINRISDFTLGDYWGIEGQHPEMNDGQGTSLVFVHTNKAQDIWNEISNDLRTCEVDAEQAIQWNRMAVASTPYNDKKEEFFNRYESENFESLVWELAPKPIPKKVTLMRRIMRKVKRILKL